MRSKPFRLFALAAAALLATGAAQAQTGPAAKTGVAPPPAVSPPAGKADPRAEIAKKVGGIQVEDVRITPVDGLFEITHNAQITYVSSDGRYAILGDMFDLQSNGNITEARRRGLRARMIAAVPESEMVVFAPKEPAKYTITVFTDIDCGYCRRLHSQIAEYNRLGIRVRYLFFPRTGPDTESWHKAESVWCAPNRNDALTRAKNGEVIKSPKCPADIVKRDYELGEKLDVEGTPAIFLASGELLPGYEAPAKLAKYLKSAKM